MKDLFFHPIPLALSIVQPPPGFNPPEAEQVFIQRGKSIPIGLSLVAGGGN